MDSAGDEEHPWAPGAEALTEELRRETDRGRVLVCAAAIDESLRRMLEAAFAEGRVGAALLEGGNAPLGTFSARSKLCFALGLLKDEEYRDIEIIRGMRNDFAHQIDVRFDRQTYVDRCKNLNLKPITHINPDGSERLFGPRDFLVSSTIFLIHRLYRRALRLRRERPRLLELFDYEP